MANFENRRRRMFIDAPEQFLFALRSTVHILIFLLAAAILIYGPAQPGLRLSETQRVTNEFLYALGPRFWYLLPALALVWLVCVIGSHRAVGPVFGFKNTLRAVIDGDFSQRLTHRKGDHFGELADILNEAVESQRRTLVDLRGKVAAIEEGLKNPGRAEAARQAASEASRILAEFRL